MVSPLGPSIANIFVGYQEQRLFANYRRPPVYLRYVDDTFVILKNEKERRRFHQLLNDLHPSLSFTCESEKDDQLPFLDVMVERKILDIGLPKANVHRSLHPLELAL